MSFLHAEYLGVEFVWHLVKDFIVTLLPLLFPLLLLNQVLLYVFFSELRNLVLQ